MPFSPALKPETTEVTPPLWFAFFENRLLTKIDDDGTVIPLSTDFDQPDLSLLRRHFLGSLNGRHCYAVELDCDRYTSDQLKFKDLRQLFGLLPEDMIWIAGRANHIVTWSLAHQYCGQCGNPTKNKSDERAKTCPQCGLINYPRLSPAVIVAVRRGNQLLLAQGQRFKTGFYSVLAGFVEPGETLEDCVHREIFEEVGIEVKNIRYFGSQPWPFPDSLMLGFTAEYAAGKIQIDKSEIVDAGWFTADDLPPIPPRISIARQLIDWFVNGSANHNRSEP